MDNFETVVLVLDDILSSRRKRHIIGGVLMSVSLLFVGLSFTTLSIKMEDKKYE